MEGKELHRRERSLKTEENADSGRHTGVRICLNQRLWQRNLDAVQLSILAECQEENAILILQDLHLDLTKDQKIIF